MITRRQFGTGLVALSAVMSARGVAVAAEQTLRFGSITIATAPLYAKVLEPFAHAVEQQSGGRLVVALKPSGGYGAPAELFSQVEKGDIEIAQTIQGYQPARFPQTSVVELPLMFDNAVSGAKVLQALFKEGLLDKDYASIKVLALSMLPPISIFTTGKKIASVKDLRGLRVRVSNPTFGRTLARLGAIPLGIPYDKIGDAVANNTVDAVAYNMDSAVVTPGAGGKFLYEQLSVVADVHFAATALMVVMNRATWDALPADLQAIVAQAGEVLGAEDAREREEIEASARKKLQADTRYTYVTFAPEQSAELARAMAPTYDDWKADMSKRGIDGERLLSRARELVKQSSVASK